MANPARRVTQADIARAVGVDRATVSLALRKRRGIPEATRLRIEKAAAELGYVPDPMLSALANYRNQTSAVKFRGTLAWFAETTADYRWRDVSAFTSYLAAAERAAHNSGYRVEVYDVSEMGVSWTRAAAIAKARGVNGILVCPQARAQTFLDDFPWQDFSAVTFGYSLTRPQLHSVTTSHYGALSQVMSRLLERGYRRIGLCLRPEHAARLRHTFLAAYLVSGYLNPSLEIPPVCPDDGHESDGHVLREWLRVQRPDALVTANHNTLPLLEAWQIKVPDDLGVACAGVPSGTVSPGEGGTSKRPRATKGVANRAKAGDLSGVIEDDERIGEVAVDLLASMIQRGERGIPAKPHRVLVEGIWHEGRSLVPAAPSKN